MKHYFTATRKVVILQNMMMKKDKLKKKNIIESNKMDIHQVGIVKLATILQQIKKSMIRKALL